MKLTVNERTSKAKGVTSAMRRDGKIPAVVYNKGSASDMIAIDGAEFEALLREIPKGGLSTTKIKLSNGKEVIVKDVQYHPTTYKTLHLDFEELDAKTLVRANVPVRCTGVVDCIGIKLGGFQRQVIRQVRVECLPKDLPSEFSVDIRELDITQAKRLSDITLPKAVRLLASEKEVVVVIAKR